MIIRVDNNRILEKNVDIRSRFPEKQFPQTITAKSLPPGYYLVRETDRPTPAWDQEIVEQEPALLDGNWQSVYKLVTLNDIVKRNIVSSYKHCLIDLLNFVTRIKQYCEFTYRGHTCIADKQNIAVIAACYTLAMNDPNYSVHLDTWDQDLILLQSNELIGFHIQINLFYVNTVRWQQQLLEQIQKATDIADLKTIRQTLISNLNKEQLAKYLIKTGERKPRLLNGV